MSFGLQNLGVINQKQSPAIWQSDIADFPANFIAGRILIDTFQGGIYIDTAINRVQIQAGGSGVVNYINGIVNTGGSPNTSTIQLGGDLIDNININSNNFAFQIDSRQIATITDNPLTVNIPNADLFIYDVVQGVKFKIACQSSAI
jgi:hypothetical protein